MFHEGGNEVRQEIFRLSGAAVMGRRMFDLGVDPWGDDPPFSHARVRCYPPRPRASSPAWGNVMGGANTIQEVIASGAAHLIFQMRAAR